MAELTRNFNKGIMNKVVDERLIPDGQYIDALNVRMGSTEQKSIGAIENTKGNLKLTNLIYIDGTPLSNSARTIGAFEDGAKETIYWFIHDSDFPVGATGKLDLIVSFNVLNNILTYHVISIDDGDGVNTTLNFNPRYVITGINKIDDLLFWTDDYNPPRFINVTENYPNPSPSNIDYYVAIPPATIAPNPAVFKERLQVIKKPPVASPNIQLTNLPGQETFLNERFICFAYRYRYSDNEYSAISQFTEPAFIPNPFEFSNDSYLNGGMINDFNTAIITYNSGGPLVVGIDLLFKEMESNVIRVIEKLNKSELGLLDNADYTYSFNNSKIYTVLPESEILRLYDNVPLLAKAQTIMGNRLMYGNYLEGYDLIDRYGNEVKIEYTTDLKTDEIGITNLDYATAAGNYTINGAVSVPSALFQLDLSGVPLTAGSSITIDFSLTHASFSGSTPYPSQTNSDIDIYFTYYLPTTFATVFDMVSDSSFQNAIGTLANVQSMANSCNGTTLSDAFNCTMIQNLNTYIKYQSGIATANQLVSAGAVIGNDTLFIQFPAVAYVDNTASPTYTVYEYMKIVSAECSFSTISQNQSLHSNRDYEIGIVYMDEFNRSTTTLVSQYNTEHVPCDNSDTKNSIQVTIPIWQVAPSWATRYKFVIKADRDNYETIYSNIFFVDTTTSFGYFLLEGENTRKVEVGSRLIVKRDTSGAVDTCAYATVLEKQSQPANFIQIPNPLNPSVDLAIPSGVYMKIKPNTFNAAFSENAFISPGLKTEFTYLQNPNSSNGYPFLYYPMNLEDPANPGQFIDYTIPQGSQIKMYFQFRRGKNPSNKTGCESRWYTLEKTFVSQSNYPSMYDWWIGDDIASKLNDGDSFVGPANDPTMNCPIQNVFIPTITNTLFDIPRTTCINYYRFYRDLATNRLYLTVTGTNNCGTQASLIDASFEILRAESLFVFETEPSDTLPDVFFENELSFPIDSLGQHAGNVQDQDFALGLPAIIDTGFFNCYAFGNGVESYKIRDSILGNYITLGNKVTTIAAEDYRAIRRYSDITYSGIYNNESNVNKLNEFNLGLLNFKPLERLFGPIFIMDARQTDVLVLQEDKISYVLADKNLLSDAAAGGAITSVPEVLGTQIARVEKYGISFNPESYIQWGEDRYFTDVKRGAVINLKDSETGLSQLQVISDAGMATWFRDLFIEDFDTQKLGAYDPYTKEYVLSSNNEKIPTVDECLECGFTQEFIFTQSKTGFEYCVNVGQIVGDVEITYNVTSIAPGVEFEISVDYNGTPYTTGFTSFDGTLTIDKDSNVADTLAVSIETTGATVLEITVNCPTANKLTIVEVVLTNNSDSGKSIYSQWRYTDGTFVGSLQNSLVLFATGVNPVVSRFNAVTGYQGAVSIPTNGSTVRMASDKFPPTDFDFNPLQNKFRYLRTNTVYNNNTANINALVAASSVGTTLGAVNYYYSDVPAGTSGNFLYLIWDLRSSFEVDLCWSADPLDIDYVCCDCDPCSDPCREWSLQNVGLGTATVNYTNCSGVPQTQTIPEGQTRIICGLPSDPPTVAAGGVYITVTQECGCRS